jgi:RNA recognition motif-containing protein
MNLKPNAKVFVGRLPEGCTAKDMEDLFSTYGSVNQCDIIGKYGFVVCFLYNYFVLYFVQLINRFIHLMDSI